MIVQGHQQVFSTMQSGERVIGAEGSDPRSFAHGHDVPNQTIVYPSEGAFFVSSPTAIIKGARSPNAAKLFAQFMISPAAQSDDRGRRHPRVPLRTCRRRPACRRCPASRRCRSTSTTSRSTTATVKARFNEIFQ